MSAASLILLSILLSENSLLRSRRGELQYWAVVHFQFSYLRTLFCDVRGWGVADNYHSTFNSPI